MMQVLHASSWYPPYNTGGTEVYLAGLIAGLAKRNISCRVLVPRVNGAPDGYKYLGTCVSTYAFDPTRESEYSTGDERDNIGRQRFREIVAEAAERHPDTIYHQHSWTPNCGAWHLRTARAVGLKTVLTVHMPNMLCLRGTMMRYGETPCDGLVSPPKCLPCWASKRGAPRSVARLLHHVPLAAAKLARQIPIRAALAVGGAAVLHRHTQQFREAINNADRIVAVSRWLHDALASNGVPGDRLVLSRHGVSAEFADACAAERQFAPNHCRMSDEPLRLVYLGRFAPAKGIELAIRAVRDLPSSLCVHLEVYGVAGWADERDFKARMLELVADDDRITICDPLPRASLPQRLVGFDAMLVPSQVLETGPLVVLEARAAGLYVIGSRLGGIAELIQSGRDGELVASNDIAAWRKAIMRLAERKIDGRLPRLQTNVRTMTDVAREMAHVYESQQSSGANAPNAQDT